MFESVSAPAGEVNPPVAATGVSATPRGRGWLRPRGSSHRAEDYGGPGQDPADAGRILAERGIDPLVVGQRVLEAVKADEDYVLTHWDFREQVEKHHRRIRAAFDYWEKSPAINTLPKREPPPIGGVRAV